MSGLVKNYLDRSEKYFSDRIDGEIERNRKGDFQLVFVKKNGELADGEINVKAEMKRIDFDFGANIFMLGEYDTEEENRRYEEKFLSIFNYAVVPLYWDGTEPNQGDLRYDKDTPRDVFRRPPVEYAMNFCEENGLKMKGHPLFWHEFSPSWLPENYQDVKKLIVKRFREISERCADRIAMFDVVNEPSRIYDVYMRDRYLHRKPIVPEDDYCVWLFRLARNLFPANKLILNDATGACFGDFRGKYSGYYLTIKDLLSRGVEIDEIGFQCHLGMNKNGENVYDSERLCNILDTYADLGKTINVSEISIPSGEGGGEELQAEAAVRLYKTVFSHHATTGLTWWNLPDDGVMVTKRKAGDENLPSTALIDFDYNEKLAYKELKKLIREEWTTKTAAAAKNGIADFRGFYGQYEITAVIDGKEVRFDADFSKNSQRVKKVYID